MGQIIHQMRVDMEVIQSDLIVSNIEPTQENPLGMSISRYEQCSSSSI